MELENTEVVQETEVQAPEVVESTPKEGEVTPKEGEVTPKEGGEVEAPKKELTFQEKLAKKQKELEAKAAAPKTPAPEVKNVPPGDPKAAPAAPATKFTPNLKFKVRNQEIDVPKWMHGSITDEASQKEAHDILTKAHGLEVIKSAFDKQSESHAQVVDQLQAYQEVTKSLRSSYQRGDFDSFFNQMRIPVEKVLQWVADKVRYNELEPEQRQHVDARREAQQRAWQAEDQLAGYQQSATESEVRARTLSLDSELAKPEINAVMEAFDAKVGKPGAFRTEVINRGQLAAFTRKIDLSPEEAVKEVLAMYGSFVTPAAPAPQGEVQPPVQQVQSPQAPAPAATTVKKAPPVIPNVAGTTQGPAQKAPVRSLEDLKKIYKSMS